MTGWIEAANALSESWAETIWRACWQGGLAVIVVWGGCRLWRSLPPAMHGWLWRLVYLKFVVLLVWVAPIELPLLPARPDAVSGRSVSSAPRQNSEEFPAGVELSSGVERELAGSVSVSRAVTPSLPEDSAGTSPARPSGMSLLALAWLVGIGWGVVRIVRHGRYARKLRRQSRPADDAYLVACCAELCSRFGLRRAPGVLVSNSAGGPLLVGIFRPVIVIPTSLLKTMSQSEQRMILAHELAHLARRDLLWNWLAAVVHTLFFFHPLVWLAARNWKLAQEAACDALVLRRSGAKAAEYGELLIRASTSWSRIGRTNIATVGVIGTYRTLKWRLLTMKRTGRISRTQVIAAALAVCGFAAVGVVPWQLVAQDEAGGERTVKGIESVPSEKADRPASAAKPGGAEIPDGDQPDGSDKALVADDVWIKPLHDVMVAAERDGVIAEIGVEEGESVKVGQEIAKLRNGVKQAALEVRHAKKLVELANAELDKAAFINRRAAGTVPDIELARLKSGIEIAQIALEKAEAEYASLQQSLEIQAPIDGVVDRLFKSKGEAVRRGDPVAQIVGTKHVQAEGYVRPRDLWKIEPGDPVTVQVVFADADLSVEKETFRGKLAGVSFKIDPATGMARVWATVENRDKLLRPGFRARMTIHPSKPSKGKQ